MSTLNVCSSDSKCQRDDQQRITHQNQTKNESAEQTTTVVANIWNGNFAQKEASATLDNSRTLPHPITLSMIDFTYRLIQFVMPAQLFE